MVWKHIPEWLEIALFRSESIESDYFGLIPIHSD